LITRSRNGLNGCRQEVGNRCHNSKSTVTEAGLAAGKANRTRFRHFCFWPHNPAIMLPNTVRRTIQHFHMLEPADSVLVGVSGGADSVCLLRVLCELGYRVTAAHVNHGLRGQESDAEEAFVHALCARLNVPLFVRKVNLPTAGNLEAAGREVRRQFFHELLETQDIRRVALAHNREDRVETFLLNLFRGAGAEGLSSMEAVKGNIIRPLIEISRNEIEADLRGRGQQWRTDSSNFDTRFARNRLRHDVIPQLSTSFNVSLVDALSRTMAILDDENAWLSELSQSWLERHGTNEPESSVINAGVLAREPRALQRRILRLALRRVNGLENVTFDHVESALDLLDEGKSGKLVQFPGGITIERSFGQLIVRNRTEPIEEFEYDLPIPGEVHIPELSKVFRARFVTEDNSKSNTEQVFVDGGSIGPYVRIRNWKPGDYYRPVGLPAGKLKKLFQRARIPRSQRHRWPVFVADSRIVWVASFPVAREFAPRGCSQKIVAFEASPF
jgi:tRNA(Ile)-lysidine synthase